MMRIAGCRIQAVGKRRDGGTRYWCMEHRASATAKYGRRASRCRHADIPPVLSDQRLVLDVGAFRGGVAIWGAVPPIYDTTEAPVEQGVHVHARKVPGGAKDIDGTFREVEIQRRRGTGGGPIVISELEAVYYMVSSMFNCAMRSVTCDLCGCPHLDKDWFSVHSHQRHLCAGCGRHFRDTERSIGNPIAAMKELFGSGAHKVKPARRKIEIEQARFLGGIQLWGSNPALLWTAQRAEEEGIHVHALDDEGSSTLIDDTFSRVVIDGTEIDAAMVRTLMAQSALPHIAGRVVGMQCPRCCTDHFDQDLDAFTPHETHKCQRCARTFRGGGRMRKTIGNPVVATLAALGARAPRPSRKHQSTLLVEAI